MADIEAVIFDQDGVLADTEKDGHRVAFNRAFKEFGLNIEWDVQTYGELLEVGGGKERMRHYFIREGLDKDIDDFDALIVDLHKRKTDFFAEIIEEGEIGLRPGVARLVREVHDAGVALAVCSTSNALAVNTLVRTLLGEEAYGWFDIILAGDVVKVKKPDPEIYHLAAKKLNVNPVHCVVIEDSRNGLVAAKDAGMKCVVTVNDYTRNQGFNEADLVVTCLGDADGEQATALASAKELDMHGVVTVGVLKQLLE